MKKITTLAMALLAMGSLATSAWAQVVSFTPPTSNIESGWYQIRQVKGCQDGSISLTAPRYVYSHETGNSYTWLGTTNTQKTDATAFVWVDKGANYAIQSINGKWAGIRAEKSDNRPAGYSIKAKDETNKTFNIGSYWDDWKSFNGFMGGSSNANYSVAEFQFSKVSDADLKKYDIYKLSFTTYTSKVSIANMSLTCTSDYNKGTKTVWAGGHYFFKAGTEVKETDFTYPTITTPITGVERVVTIDAKNQILNVSYWEPADLTALLATSKDLIVKRGIGYPTTSSAAYSALESAISAASTTSSPANYNSLLSAYNSYCSTTDIQKPEDGKAYTMTALFYDGTTHYMNYKDTGYELVQTTAKDNTSYPVTATLICRKVGDKFTFTNNDGKYFTWKGMEEKVGANGNKGYVDTYNKTYDISIHKIVKSTWVTDKENADMMGYVGVQGYRILDPNKGKTEQDYFVFMLKETPTGKTYGYSQANQAFFTSNNNGKYSSLIKIEEVTYPNHVTFNATGEDIKDVKNIATFSAPFATIVPEGVTAWYVDGENGEKATLKAVENGKAIPANQGVLLTSETGSAVTMVPVADEAVASISDNKLKASAGAEKTLTDADNAYILGKSAAGKVAFFKGKIGSKLGMNKAYLEHAAGAAAIALDFNLGTTTGIQNAVVSEQSNAPIYDLSGRRVQNTVKGGFYIQGGKKFIAQ